MGTQIKELLLLVHSVNFISSLSSSQSADALKALKDIKVIHSDIKLNNVMLDIKVQPFTVKLIDFGLTFHSSEARQGDNHQVARHR